jgi:aminomethyltransferase
LPAADATDTPDPAGQAGPGGTPLRETPLADLHRALGARMVPFAGHAMPVQYAGGPVAGILAEHRHTREAAGLFDVAHMGQAVLAGPDAAAALEGLVPADLAELAPGRLRYTQLTDDAGGILDDLMVIRPTEGALSDWAEAAGAAAGDEALLLVVNAATKDADMAHIAGRLAGRAHLLALDARALLALQGPAAAAVLGRLATPAALDGLRFLDWRPLALDGIGAWVSRSGYTGEDGFEISLPAGEAEALARRLLAEPEVAMIGLGARDSLRLEAGLCLYGQDIDRTTSPVEAGLSWSIGRRRRREGGFPGARRILAELADGPPRRRVGLLADGRQPVRAGADVTDDAGRTAGRVTSGGFSPTLERPVAMALVDSAHAAPGTALAAVARPGRSPQPATVAPLPFVPPRYRRG